MAGVEVGCTVRIRSVLVGRRHLSVSRSSTGQELLLHTESGSRRMRDDTEACIFCDIVRGEAGSNMVYENDVVTAFLDTCPVTPGHVLVKVNSKGQHKSSGTVCACSPSLNVC